MIYADVIAGFKRYKNTLRAYYARMIIIRVKIMIYCRDLRGNSSTFAPHKIQRNANENFLQVSA